MITDEQLTQLPEDPTLAFVEFERILRAHMDEQEVQAYKLAEEGVPVPYAFSLSARKLEYVTKVLAAAKAFEIPALKGWKVPSAQDDVDDLYIHFTADVDHFTTKVRIQNAPRNRQDFVSLGGRLTRQYYSVRTGRNPLGGGFDLDTMRKLFRELFIYFEDEGYFQQALGYYCVDADFVSGTLGRSIEGALLLALRKDNLAPIRERIATYDEEDLFDVIEFLYDHCSKPTERHYHGFSNCGWHCSQFDRDAGRVEFREKINQLLQTYDRGFELSKTGEVLALGDPGLAPLHEAPLPTNDVDNVAARVVTAQKKFRRHRSTYSDRRDAIRDLADVLEFLRPQLDGILTNKDDAALFNIANNFAIRHHNEKQQASYDKAIWYSWIFYFYLATIHAAVRLIEKKNPKPDAPKPEFP